VCRMGLYDGEYIEWSWRFWMQDHSRILSDSGAHRQVLDAILFYFLGTWILCPIMVPLLFWNQYVSENLWLNH
jgi:hypothetical protein